MTGAADTGRSVRGVPVGAPRTARSAGSAAAARSGRRTGAGRHTCTGSLRPVIDIGGCWWNLSLVPAAR
ncbi:hypothetical protein [Micromonospora sp. LOL_021]|uniref:hypothetical protein n=1 Tax=Micromonospora sp. LOL_021 TaxID=3345417 RepID=UPI003A88EB02